MAARQLSNLARNAGKSKQPAVTSALKCSLETVKTISGRRVADVASATPLYHVFGGSSVQQIRRYWQRFRPTPGNSFVHEFARLEYETTFH